MEEESRINRLRAFARDVTGWTVMSVIAGVLGGALVWVIDSAVDWCEVFRAGLSPILLFLLPVAGCTLVGLVLWRLGQDAEGEPMPKYINAVNRYNGRIPFSQGIAGFLGAMVTVGSGGSGGLTGPSVLVSSYLAETIGGWMHRAFKFFNFGKNTRISFSVSAAAAAISAILHAPVGGGILAVELLFRRNLEYERLFSAILSSVSGYLVFIYLSGDPGFLFANNDMTIPGFDVVGWVLVVIVMVEVLGQVFIRSYRLVGHWSALSGWPAPLRFGAAAVVVAGIAIGMMQISPDAGRAILGTGWSYLGDIVSGNGLGATMYGGAFIVLLFVIAKMIATAVTVGSGNIAGFVLPTVFYGAAIGHFVAAIAGWGPADAPTQHSALVASGIAAAMGTMLNCPLAAMIVVTEFFGMRFSWVVAVGALLAYRLSPDTSVYQFTSDAERVLVVDDDEAQCIIINRILGASGYEVVRALNGEQALELLKTDRYDLILLDRGLPDMSGDDVLRSIRKDRDTADIPVIMITGMTSVHDRVEGFGEGADDYIAKPFSLPELKARVAQHIKRSRRHHTAILNRPV